MPPKRKASAELSNNPHTTKARNRLNNRNEFEIQIEKAKASDQAAITYRLKTIRRSSEWIQASELERAVIKERVKNEVIHKRKVKGVHASNIAQKLGYGDHGGQFAQAFDGNDNFEDCEIDDEALQEQIWRDDDKCNGERFIDLEGDKEEQKQKLFVHGIKKHQNLEFRLWQKAWKRVMKRFQNKCNKLNRKGVRYLTSLGPYIDRQTGKYYEIIPPHRFFTPHEMMLWRNLRATLNAGCEEGDPDWVQLPGPNEWYVEGYNLEEYGFYDPPKEDKELYEGMLLLLMHSEDSVPRDYQRVDFTCKEFRLMNSTELLFRFNV
ncbi:hypothetical protein EAE96_001784 [Botrytis aclada]|nr:hypothetical protein EAE96_001784 [Botrytis aclada]